MTMFERQAFVQARAFENMAKAHESGVYGAEMSAEAREEVAWVYRFAAEVVLRDALLCGACWGRGVEWAEPYEDDFASEPGEMVPGAWHECWCCKGSGRSYAFRCDRCGRAEGVDFRREVDGESWCMGCEGVDLLLQKRGKRFTVALEPPFGTGS